MKAPILISLCALLLISGTAQARSFRDMAPIGQPETLGAHQRRPATVRPVSAERVQQALESLARAWNGEGFAGLLDGGFPNRERLLDTVLTVVPRDARLRLISVRPSATLDQRMEALPGQPVRRISTVSVVAETQIEFNDPARGFQSLRGLNEYLLRFVETE